MASILSHGSEPASWGDMMREHDVKKKTLSWKVNDVEPVTKISMFDRKSAERELDPVSMKYRNSEKELMFSKAVEQQRIAKLDRLDTLKLTKFDILKHTGGPPRMIETMNRPNTSSAIGLNNRHIISGLNNDAHLKLTTIYNDEFVNSHIHINKPKTAAGKGNRRDFDVISNTFINNHNERASKEHNQVNAHIVDKYWQTHDYDFIKGEYYDEKKENKFKEHRDISAINHVHSNVLMSKLPAGTMYSQGNTYNILNHEIKDNERFQISNKSATQASNSKQLSRKVESRIKQKAYNTSVLQNERSLNRPAYQRWEKEIDRGYNIVNQSLEIHAPRPERPATVWAKVHRTTLVGDSSSGNRNNDDNMPRTSSSSRDLSGRRDGNNSNNNNNNSSSSNNNSSGSVLKISSSSSGVQRQSSMIPSLDLTKTEPAQPVAYKETFGGHMAEKVPMVRTGGKL